MATATSETLFEITKDHLETGLRGVPVGYCTTSSVDPQKGLHYVGTPIADLADKDPEEVIYLLFNKKLPDADELAAFKDKIHGLSALPEGAIEALKAFPKQGHPMKWFVGGLNILGMLNPKESYSDAAYRVVAQLPSLVAAIYRIRSGWGEPIASDASLGYMENFTNMLGVPNAHAHLQKVMEVFNILHYDHGGGNLSTFVGKAVASGHEDMYGSLIGAMSGLAGPLHGMANQECLKFLKNTLAAVGKADDDEAITAYLQKLMDNKEKIFGFGHAVLRVEDPRATVFYKIGQDLFPDDELVTMALHMRSTGSAFLKQFPKIQNPYPNVDAASGTLLNAVGLEDETYYTVLFGLSRCVGIAAQIVYEREQARGGKGTPIIRPKYMFKKD